MAEGATPAFVDRLPPAARTRLSSAGVARHYRPGETLFLVGDPSTFVVVIDEGRAKVTAPAPDGSEVVLSLRGPGELVGELAAVEEGSAPRTATVVALDAIRCRVVHDGEFRAILAEHPQISLELLRMVSARLRSSDRRIVEFGAYDTTRRVARLLVEMTSGSATRSHTGRPPSVALSQDDLAGLVGASRESVVRALTTLRSLGLVTTGRRRIAVVDPGELDRFGG